jgi:hypothetical protein
MLKITHFNKALSTILILYFSLTCIITYFPGFHTCNDRHDLSTQAIITGYQDLHDITSANSDCISCRILTLSTKILIENTDNPEKLQTVILINEIVIQPEYTPHIITGNLFRGPPATT